MFQNRTALSSLNNLGTYSEVHVSTAGLGTANAQVFASANLNDDAGTCGPFSPSGCWPVPNVTQVASNVTGGTTGSVTFAVNYAGKLSGGQGGQFNLYPSLASRTQALMHFSRTRAFRTRSWRSRQALCTDRELVVPFVWSRTGLMGLVPVIRPISSV